MKNTKRKQKNKMFENWQSIPYHPNKKITPNIPSKLPLVAVD